LFSFLNANISLLCMTTFRSNKRLRSLALGCWVCLFGCDSDQEEHHQEHEEVHEAVRPEPPRAESALPEAPPKPEPGSPRVPVRNLPGHDSNDDTSRENSVQKEVAEDLSETNSTHDELAKEAKLPEALLIENPEAWNPLPSLKEVDALSLTRLVTSAGIEEREPSESGTTFSKENERVYAFMEFKNDSEQAESSCQQESPKQDMAQEPKYDQNFRRPDGELTGNAELTIPAKQPRWRTWAYTRNAHRHGEWEVVVETDEEETLGTLAFRVTK
jgi:hypothetical protein